VRLVRSGQGRFLAAQINQQGLTAHVEHAPFSPDFAILTGEAVDHKPVPVPRRLVHGGRNRK